MSRPELGALLWNPELDDPELSGNEDAEELIAEDDDPEVGGSKGHHPDFPAHSIPNLLSRATPGGIPTVRWGDRVVLTFPPGSVSSPGSQQFAEVTLPRPMVCSVQFHAEIGLPILGAVSVTVLRVLFGVGSATRQQDFAFSLLPAALSPIDFTIEAVPMQRMQAQVLGVGFGGQTINATIAVAPYSGAS